MSEAKWQVYQIGRYFYTGPTRRRTIAFAKEHAGLTTAELRECGVVQVTGADLLEPLLYADEPTADTMDSVRAAAQLIGQPSYICEESD